MRSGVGVAKQRNQVVLTERDGHVQLSHRQLAQELVVVDQGRRQLEGQLAVAVLRLDGHVDEDGGGRHLDDALTVADVRNRKWLDLVVQLEQFEDRHEVGRRVLGDGAADELH